MDMKNDTTAAPLTRFKVGYQVKQGEYLGESVTPGYSKFQLVDTFGQLTSRVLMVRHSNILA